MVSLSPVVTTSTSATATTLDPCTDCVWHESINELHTCSNDPSFPEWWDSTEARPNFFFRTVDECCETRFPYGCSEEAVAGTTNSAGFYVLDKITTENFDESDLTLPFDFGTPAQWKQDDTQSHSGTHSITNVPVNNETNVMSDLTLKVNVQYPSTITCMAKIDTSMPYDYFALHINGEQRNSYHQRIDEWITVVTSLMPGDNTVVYRVQHSGAQLPADYPERDVSLQGVGQVWLDDCEVTSHA